MEQKKQIELNKKFKQHNIIIIIIIIWMNERKKERTSKGTN